MGTKSSTNKFFGHVLRNEGTPFQQWVLAEIPISKVSVITSTSTAPVPVGASIPITNVIYNGCSVDFSILGGNIVLREKGIYRIEFRMNVSTASSGKVELTLNANGNPVAQASSLTVATATEVEGELIGEKVLVVTCCSGPVSLSLTNTSPTEITPVKVGDESMEIVITKV